MRSGRFAWIALGTLPVLVTLAVVFDVAADGDLFEVLAFMVIGLPFSVVGALVASRQAEQPIGWLMLGVGLALATAMACDGAVSFLLEHPSSGVSAGWFALASSICFRFFFLSIVTTLLLIPNGRLPSPRWRVFAWAVAALAVASVFTIFLPGVYSDWDKEGIRNPVGIEPLGSFLRRLDDLTTGLTILVLLVSIASVAIRFRGARGIERAQLRWIAAAVVASGLAWVVMIVGNLLIPGRVGDVLWGLALVSIGLIPVGIGFAVLRYRLYDIDRVVSKALVYGSLTVLLAVAYAGLVLAGQALFSSFAGGSHLAIAGSTLVVAALFLPVRARIQLAVDRRFNRRRYDAQRTLDAFGLRLRQEVELETLALELRGVVAYTMQPTQASLWLRGSAT